MYSLENDEPDLKIGRENYFTKSTAKKSIQFTSGMVLQRNEVSNNWA